MREPAGRSTGVPGYWMHETSGVLRPAMEAYLWREMLTDVEVGVLRAYFRQWINAPVWCGPMIDVLRLDVGAIATRADIDRWVEKALESGVDPL
jgi:hypothetical protein